MPLSSSPPRRDARCVPSSSPAWSRRTWLVQTSVRGLGLGALLRRWPWAAPPSSARQQQQHAAQAVRWAPGDPWAALAQQGVDAARAAGAQYADVRLTRTCGQQYQFGDHSRDLWHIAEITGVGVRALVKGAWGFAASSGRTPDTIIRVARDAVAQARVNTQQEGTRPVDFGTVPVVQGEWTTPIAIDPFQLSLEEKLDFLAYILKVGNDINIGSMPFSGCLMLSRQERVLATSEGSLITQTCYETGMAWNVISGSPFAPGAQSGSVGLERLTTAAKGWELILGADIPGQLQGAAARLAAAAAPGRPASVGRYTLVCDGATMAALVDRTLGVATQLDRALGYEANASGTSFIDDPLGMVGQQQVAAPMVNLTANRTAPGQLATVGWDDEGVAAEEFPLIRDGVLVDFQTTREQAAWLAPYYAKRGWPVRSHGCAAAEQALDIQLQMQPNLTLLPAAAVVRLEDLVATVPQGILVTAGHVLELDSQLRTGILVGTMQSIRNGRLGPTLSGGGVLFDSPLFWNHVTAVGGADTMGEVPSPRGGGVGNWGFLFGMQGIGDTAKGQPAQSTSYTTRAAAAIIAEQSLINLRSKI